MRYDQHHQSLELRSFQPLQEEPPRHQDANKEEENIKITLGSYQIRIITS